MENPKMNLHFMFNHLNQTIVGTELNFKRAGKPGSALYQELMARMAEQPAYTFDVIYPEKQVQKKTYKGLTHQLMLDYLDALATEEAFDLHDQLVAMKKDGKSFASRKKYFLEHIPNFSVNKAKKVISDSNFKALKVKYKVIRRVKPETGTGVIPFKDAK